MTIHPLDALDIDVFLACCVFCDPNLLQEQPVHPEAPDFQQARRSLAAVKSPPEDLQFGPLAVNGPGWK